MGGAPHDQSLAGALGTQFAGSRHSIVQTERTYADTRAKACLPPPHIRSHLVGFWLAHLQLLCPRRPQGSSHATVRRRGFARWSGSGNGPPAGGTGPAARWAERPSPAPSASPCCCRPAACHIRHPSCGGAQRADAGCCRAGGRGGWGGEAGRGGAGARPPGGLAPAPAARGRGRAGQASWSSAIAGGQERRPGQPWQGGCRGGTDRRS